MKTMEINTADELQEALGKSLIIFDQASADPIAISAGMFVHMACTLVAITAQLERLNDTLDRVYPDYNLSQSLGQSLSSIKVRQAADVEAAGQNPPLDEEI